MNLQNVPPAPEWRKKFQVAPLSGLWDFIEPRRYQVPAGFYSPDSFGGMGVASTIMQDDGIDPVDQQTRFLISTKLGEYGVPTMMISRDLAHALRRTTVPAGLRFADLDLPFPAMRFLFEEGSFDFQHGTLSGVEFAYYKEGEIAGVPAASLPGNPTIRAGIRRPTVMPEAFILSSQWAMTGRKHDWQIREIVKTYYTPDLDCVPLGLPHGHGVGKYDGHHEAYLPPLDTEVPSVNALLTNLLFFLTARPEYVQPAAQVRGPRVSRGVTTPATFTPQRVGVGFKLATLNNATPGEVTGRKLAPGWRCGHWREVPCGQGRTQRRRLWIEPYQYGYGTISEADAA